MCEECLLYGINRWLFAVAKANKPGRVFSGFFSRDRRIGKLDVGGFKRSFFRFSPAYRFYDFAYVKHRLSYHSACSCI